MKLTRVTITGADDGIAPHHLIDLSHEYPFVEWGLLVSEKRFGDPRYPSTAWMRNFSLPDLPKVVRHSIHFCGELSRRVMGGGPALVPEAAMPRNETPWVVGWAIRLEERR